MRALWHRGGRDHSAWPWSLPSLRFYAEVVLKAEQPHTVLSQLLAHVVVDQLPLLLEDSFAEQWPVGRPRAVPWHAIHVLSAPVLKHPGLWDERHLGTIFMVRGRPPLRIP